MTARFFWTEEWGQTPISSAIQSLSPEFRSDLSSRDAVQQVSLNSPPRERVLIVKVHDLALLQLHPVHNVRMLPLLVGLAQKGDALDRQLRKSVA